MKKLYQNIKKVIGKKTFVLSFQSSELSIKFGTAIARTFGAIAQWGLEIFLKFHLHIYKFFSKMLSRDHLRIFPDFRHPSTMTAVF